MRFPLILAGVLLICFVLPRWFYSMRLAMVELRYGFIVLVLLGACLWLLSRLPGRRD